MRINEFDIYADLLKEKSGLTLTPNKSYLIESRLIPVAKQWNFETFSAMTMALAGVPDPGLVKDVVEAMTTNETSFFRDVTPFENIKTLMQTYINDNRAQKQDIRFWSAGCASGQEAYSLAMILDELSSGFRPRKFSITATDIDHTILKRAKSGVFSQFEVQYGLPVQMLLEHFEQRGEEWHIKDKIKNMVTFGYFNMLDSMENTGQFDFIFCRNVLMYFDEDTQRKTLKKIKQQLAPDGFLFLGKDEDITQTTDRFSQSPDMSSVYLPDTHPLLP